MPVGSSGGFKDGVHQDTHIKADTKPRIKNNAWNPVLSEVRSLQYQA
jgi:hypothetical protein